MEKYLVRYYNKGEWYATYINADSWDEADNICRRHNLQLEGLYQFTVKDTSFLGWLINKLT